MYIVAKSANLISLIFLVGFSWIGLTSCTYQEAQEKVHFTAFLPTDKQITLNTSMIPASLSLLHSFPQAGDPEAVEKAIAEGKLDPSARNFVYYRDNSDGSFTPQVSSNHNRLPIGFENQSIDLTDFFDPFSVDEGQVNTESNRTSVGCGIADGEPNRNQDIFRYGVYSWCTMSVLKVALHRGITHYDSFHRVMTTILENIVDDADQMDTTYTYTNPSVQSIGANGMHVTMYYNDCASSRTVGDQGRTMCLSEADSSVYHKLLIRPLVPQGGTTVDTNIGSMEWIVRADSSVRGYISMSRNLMTANTVSPYAPPQVQFDFESDAEGKFQSFVVKFGTRVITSSTPARQWTWEANVFRITRIPGSGTVPGLWTVEGSIAYELEYANPILGSEKPEPDPTAETRVYFVAVTEDVFTQGRTLFKTILVPGKESTPTSTPYAAADWDKELHLWAAYKKLLESTFTEAHYTPIVGLPLSVRQWFTQSGTQIYKGGISRGPISKSADESRLAIAVNSELRIYERSRYGAYDLLGVCRPFGPDSTDRLTNPAFNPNNPDQVLVAEQSGSIYQARVVNISTIATSSTCDTDLTFAHPLTDPTPRLQYVDFTTVGSQTLILTQNNNFVRIWDITNNLTPILQVPSPTTSTYVAKFDSTGQRVLMTGYEGGSLAYGTYALDIATGNILTLRDDSCNFEPLTVCSHSMWTMTAVFNNPVLTNEIITSSVGGTATVPETNGHVFRWNISSWDPSLGSDTWLVSNSSSSRLVQNIAYTHADNSIAYANNAAINDAGTELAVLHNTSIDYYPVNGVGQIDAAAVRTVPLRAAATQPSTNYSYAPLYVNNDRHLYVTGNTSVIYKLDPTLNVKSPHAFLNGHVGAAYNAIYSSDGKYVLTPGEDGTAVLWQELDGTVVLKLSGHTDRVTSAVFTHGETRILTSSDDGTLRLWDVVDGSPTFGQTLQTYTGHTAGVAHVDYSDTFGRHRFASAGKDGTINIYSDTQATPIQSYPGVFTVSATVYPANWVDFSDDGAFLVAAGASSSSNLAVFDTNPDSTYGAYNLLGTAAPIAGSINSVVFFPGDNSRTLTTSASPRTSVVSIVTLTPNVTDPIGIPPTATVITDIVLGSGRIADGGVMAIVSNNLHGIITDGRGSSSGSSSTSCYGCSVLSHWDLNPSSATYGQRYNLATPSQPATYNGGGNEQNYPKLLSGNMSNDGFRVIASSPGSRYEPSWIDFTKHFTDNGYPDNKVVVGPYFVEHVWSNSGCFMMSVTQVCTAVCSDFGGCYGYTITSRLTLEQRGELAQKQTDFDDLITQMDAMEAASPYAGYYLDRYVFQPIQ